MTLSNAGNRSRAGDRRSGVSPLLARHESPNKVKQSGETPLLSLKRLRRSRGGLRVFVCYDGFVSGGGLGNAGVRPERRLGSTS
jgi:hypothetical protein